MVERRKLGGPNHPLRRVMAGVWYFTHGFVPGEAHPDEPQYEVPLRRSCVLHIAPSTLLSTPSGECPALCEMSAVLHIHAV